MTMNSQTKDEQIPADLVRHVADAIWIAKGLRLEMRDQYYESYKDKWEETEREAAAALEACGYMKDQAEISSLRSLLTEEVKPHLKDFVATAEYDSLQKRYEASCQRNQEFLSRALTAEKEVERLRAGNFTKEEIHDICHNLHGTVGANEFTKGCTEEQRKLYGCAPDADALATAVRLLQTYVFSHGARNPEEQKLEQAATDFIFDPANYVEQSKLPGECSGDSYGRPPQESGKLNAADDNPDDPRLRLALRGGRLASLVEMAVKLRREDEQSASDGNLDTGRTLEAIEWLADVRSEELTNLGILCKSAWDKAGESKKRTWRNTMTDQEYIATLEEALAGMMAVAVLSGAYLDTQDREWASGILRSRPEPPMIDVRIVGAEWKRRKEASNNEQSISL
jgi:hypothetical protein